MTLWDLEAKLKTTLTNDTSQEAVRSLEFGRGPASRLLYAALANHVYIWDLLPMQLVWSLAVGGEILSLASCPLTGQLAVLAKDHVTLLNTWDRSIVATVRDVHATAGGGAVYGVTEGQADLYYVTYTGLVKRIGPRRDRANPSQEALPAVGQAAASAVGPLALPKASGRTGEEIAAQTRSSAAGGEDVAALLSVPLHALPAPSVLAKSFLYGRVVGLPKLKAPALATPEEATAVKNQDKLLADKRIRSIFQTEKKKSPPLDLKSFAVLLRKSASDNKNIHTEND